jgi:succinyl-diaminopimelate desuccinylase
MLPASIESYLTEQASRFESDLFELLSIASISADSAYQGHIRQAAHWLAEHFRAMGLPGEVIPTPGHPLVYAESPPVPGAPTALVYGHYDVQPPDPLEEWISPPFEPTVRDGKVYARGATDDKGQMLTHVKSLEAWLRSGERLPLQVKILIEGEEEVGSEQLAAYLATHAERLQCDCVVVSDTSQFAPGVPAITYGLRGIAYFELLVSGPSQDLHSGIFGGGVANPALALARMLSSLIDDQGRIQVPGFYDGVVDLSEREKQEFAALPFSDEEFARQLGVNELAGEAGYSTIERRWARPSLDINGLWGGYQGEGAKTVLPARAGAKLSFRLVPDQEPDQIVEGLRAHLARHAPPGVRWELREHHHAPGVVFPLESPYLQAAGRAVETGFGKRPVFIREGGSIPIVNRFARELKADVLLLGWGQNDDNLHSPNEKFSLADFHRGIRASAALWQELAAIPTSAQPATRAP